MSILEVPRILFRGDMSWDPIVTNNTDTFYDETTGEPVFPTAAGNVKAFRQAAVASVTKGGNWNPHGTHRSSFYDASISAVDLGSSLDTHDPFVSSAANFSGMLVDLEPFGAFSSQLFFDRIVFGVDGGYRILAPRSTRVTARYINFARNPANNMIAGIASVVWQTSFPKQNGLRVDPFDSPALQALAAALQTDDVSGLTVRFNAYRTVYFENPTLSNGSPQSRKASLDLQTKLNGSGFQPNPSRSRFVGAIGLWRKGEPLHEPGDRALLPGASPLGAAYARLSQGSLTLDLSNCVPETSRDLTKKDLGALTVVAVDPATSNATPLGTLTYAQYDRAAYEASSGIVTIPLTPALAGVATTQDIQLRDSTGAVLLGEQRLRAIPVTPNLYLNEGDSTVGEFQVYDHGTPATSATPVSLYTMSADGGTIGKTDSLTTNAAGVLSFPLGATPGGGIVALVASPMGANPPTQGINPQVNTYMYVRTLPADAEIGALPASWDNVYSAVLANWNAMAPCMDNWLNLADPAQVKAYAGVLTLLTDPANFESFRFMPVTRDMTSGERTLLRKFLEGEAGEIAPHAAAAPATAHFAALSRSLRRG
jgi:hypothetical protein